MPARLVSIIGPPASGKTTLAEWLAQALPARLLREDYAGNPFLEAYYLGDESLALPAQLYFLFSRAGQLSRRRWPDSGWVVSDYGFCQDAVYAARNLTGSDAETYARLALQAGRAVHPPELVLHLDAGPELLLERISLRARRHEMGFTGEFLNELRRAYAEVAAALPCAVETIPVDRRDLRQPAVRDRLLERLREALG